jgi:hypothetical protein
MPARAAAPNVDQSERSLICLVSSGNTLLGIAMFDGATLFCIYGGKVGCGR